MGGIRTSSTSDDTTFPNAAPIITPTARSSPLPRIANSLNSFSTGILLTRGVSVPPEPGAAPLAGRGFKLAGIISERRLALFQNQEATQRAANQQDHTRKRKQSAHPRKGNSRDDQHDQPKQ